MAEIISLETKFRHSETKKAEMDRLRKIRLVQKLLRRLQTTTKCEKCGARVNQNGDTLQRPLQIPYNFCTDCSEEYMDYIEQLKGNGNPDNYWHNGAWRKTWRAWIDYQNTIDQFLKTKEFKQLLKETKPN
ncbi:MAG: hypothetical protein PVI90_12805 [Desulfobacteraceae bacterium]|jgi:hypothetical protein